MKKCLVILTIIFINLLLSTPSFSGCSMPTDFSVPHTERGVTYSDVLHLYDACAGHEMTLFYNPDNSQGYPAFRVYGGWQWWIQVTEAIWYYDGNLYGCDENNIQLYVPQITNQSIGQMGIDSGCRTNYVSTQNAYNYYSPYALFLSANSFQLTVSPDPVAGGGVASTDQEIECGYNSNNYCQYNYTLNSEVELTAYPNTGYAFAYWEWNGGASSSTNNPETFTMNEALEVTAKFFQTFRNAVGNFKQSSGNGGECVPYVRYETEISYDACNGPAYQCFSQAQAQNYSTGSTPREGAIIVFDIDTSKNMDVGHVGVVKSINGDGTITIHDSNWCLNDCQLVSEHDEYPADFEILGYIYFTP
ncbi:MAG: CHAP domain-containing protein [Candidatus Moraniibacteriota bacterium]